MNKACVFFKISDITRHIPRNYKRYPDVVKEKNFVYDEGYGNYTRADLFYPKNRNGTLPVIVNVHGGGFVKGGKVHRTALCSLFATEGYFVYNVNYRLAPQYPFPSAIIDVVHALNKLPDLAEKYDLNLTKVILTGDSAGAFYAAAATLCAVNPDFASKVGVKSEITPYAYMGFCGAYRLEDLLLMKTPLNVSYDIADALFGGKMHGDAEIIKQKASFPLTDLVAFVNGAFPKSFLLYSKYDTFCGGQGEMLSEKLKSLGVSVTDFIATDKKDGHCFHLFPFHKTTPKAMESVQAFLKTL